METKKPSKVYESFTKKVKDVTTKYKKNPFQEDLKVVDSVVSEFIDAYSKDKKEEAKEIYKKLSKTIDVLTEKIAKNATMLGDGGIEMLNAVGLQEADIGHDINIALLQRIQGKVPNVDKLKSKVRDHLDRKPVHMERGKDINILIKDVRSIGKYMKDLKTSFKKFIE